MAIADFWRTSHHDGKISPGWWRWGVHAHPLSAYYHHVQSCSARSCWEGRYTLPYMYSLVEILSVYSTNEKRDVSKSRAPLSGDWHPVGEQLCGGPPLHHPNTGGGSLTHRCHGKHGRISILAKIRQLLLDYQYRTCRGLQRDVICLGRPIAPSYMSPNAWGGRELRALSH